MATGESEGENISRKLMYLPYEYWSPRYDHTFFTVRLESFRRITQDRSSSGSGDGGGNGHDADESDPVLALPPPPPPELGGKRSLPAYYYEITIHRQRDKRSVFRRYSQFQWLYQQVVLRPPAPPPSAPTATEPQLSQSQSQPALAAAAPPPPTPIRLPPGSCPYCCGQWQYDEFARNRLEQLADFLTDLLRRPGYATHPAMMIFLELQN